MRIKKKNTEPTIKQSNDAIRRELFVKKLAQYLVGNQAHMSISLQMRRPEAVQWAELRGATPLFGYPTLEEAEATLRKFLRL